MSKTEIQKELESRPGTLYGDMGFTDWHELNHAIIHSELINFLNRKDVKIISVSIGKNNYGKFQFVTCAIPRTLTRDNGESFSFVECVTFYGSGWHEYRDILKTNWDFMVGNSFLVADKNPMIKRDAIKQIESYRLERGIKKDSKVNKGTNKFSFIADLTDDDYAMVNME